MGRQAVPAAGPPGGGETLSRVAVLGATGTIGRPLVEALAGEHEVVAISRRRTADRPGVTTVAADAADETAVRAALDGVEVVYHLIHSLDATDFESRDRAVAKAVAGAAAAVGARQIVYLGGIGGAGLSSHLRSRAETGALLAAGAVPVTTLGAAMVVGPGSAAFETIVALVDRLPVMVTPRWVRVATQPVALADIVAVLAAVCGLEAAMGERFDVGGPEVMTYGQMIERIGELRGRHPLLVQVPFLTPRLSSLWLHLVTPAGASVSRRLVDGMRTPTVAADDRIWKVTGVVPTSFDEAARTALAR